MKKILAVVALVMGVTLALAACAPATEHVTLGADTVILDVRTPEEYAQGHLKGAVNIDVTSADFATIISQLPTDGEYFLYCRSGNRSTQAIEIMKASGFTHLTNGGSVENASEVSGVPIVTEVAAQ